MAAAAGGSACSRKLLTVADVAGILTEPITGTKVIPGDPQSCKFTTSGFASITVMVRPGLGKVTLASWKGGKMPIPSAPLAGVGDDAAWAEDLHEVIAEKNNVLCDIQALGSPSDLAGSTADQQKRIGALCNKIFAAVK